MYTPNLFLTCSTSTCHFDDLGQMLLFQTLEILHTGAISQMKLLSQQLGVKDENATTSCSCPFSVQMRWGRNRQEAFFVKRKRTANGDAKGRCLRRESERRYGQSNATWNQQDINGQGDASSKLFWVFLSGKDQCYLYVWIIFFYAKAKKTINFPFRLLSPLKQKKPQMFFWGQHASKTIGDSWD